MTKKVRTMRVQYRVVLVELQRESKVRYDAIVHSIGSRRRTVEDVFRFEISMNDIFLVKVCYRVLCSASRSARYRGGGGGRTYDEGVGDLFRFRFAEPTFLNQVIVQLSTRRELKDDVVLLPRSAHT